MWGKRKSVQLICSFLHNPYLAGFWQKSIYKGGVKNFCFPGLNCYSCPSAIGSCPIGAFQSVVNGFKYQFSFYVAGFILLFGAIAGRFICGWICPFGLYQELLYKIPLAKKRLYKPLLLGKYLILLIFVLILPIFLHNQFGLGTPAFCKAICPAGFLEAGIPALFIFPSLQSLIGKAFYLKLTIFLLVTSFCVSHYRFFCRVACPLGALYAVSNKFSCLQIGFDKDLCINCGKCQQVCRMEVDIRRNQKDLECIRCGDCLKICPTNALKFTSVLAKKENIANASQAK